MVLAAKDDFELLSISPRTRLRQLFKSPRLSLGHNIGKQIWKIFTNSCLCRRTIIKLSMSLGLKIAQAFLYKRLHGSSVFGLEILLNCSGIVMPELEYHYITYTLCKRAKYPLSLDIKCSQTKNRIML